MAWKTTKHRYPHLFIQINLLTIKIHQLCNEYITGGIEHKVNPIKTDLPNISYTHPDSKQKSRKQLSLVWAQFILHPHVPHAHV